MKRFLAAWRWWRIDLAGAAALAALTAAVGLGGVLPLLADHQECLALQEELAAQRDQAAKLDVTMAAARCAWGPRSGPWTRARCTSRPPRPSTGG